MKVEAKMAAIRAAVKAGRVLSAENEDALKQAEELISDARNDTGSLGQAEALLEQVLKQVDPSYDDATEDAEEEAATPATGTASRPTGALEVKSFPLAQVKALDAGDQPGSFEALVAVFGNVDTVGDRIEKGAFAKSIATRGLPPIVWSHNWDVPPIGAVKSAEETDQGLLIKGRLFVGPDEDHPVARQVYTAMKAKDGNGQSPLREFSFGYAVTSSSDETEDGKSVRVLKELDLFEAGPTLVGANPQTRLIGVKAIAEELKLAAQQADEKKTTPDNPAPTPAPAGKEAKARIGLWLTEHPRHEGAPS